MNFVQQLEESLRDLAAEARKRHPGVEEASERATRTLRQYKNAYVTAVRQANAAHSHGASGVQSLSSSAQCSQPAAPTTKLFQSSELLHPFLLAANYPNASPKLLEISFRAMRLLLEADAVVPSDAIHLVRVWMIQAQVVASFYQKHYHHKLPNQHRSTPPPVKENSMVMDEDSCQFEASSQEMTGGSTAATNSCSTSSNKTTSSISWFFWSSSSSTTTAPSTTSQATTTTTTSGPASGSHVVSSSTGKTGHSSSLASAKEMEKLALDVLSSLLQLMQEMHRNHPQHLVVDTVLWKHAFGVVCVCLSPSMNSTSSNIGSKKKPAASGGSGGPGLSVIQQAAHSTLSQILTLLYEPIPMTKVSSEDHDQTEAKSDLVTLQEASWQDLLLLSKSAKYSSSSAPSVSSMLQGAFALCRTTSAAVSAASTSLSKKSTPSPTPVPPSPKLALRVLTKVWRNSEYQLSEKLSLETLQMTVTLVQNIGVTESVEATQAVLQQWASLVLSKLSPLYPKESFELIQAVLQLVATATDSFRNHPDFEDGFVYSQAVASSLGDTGNPTSTMSRSAMTHSQPQQQQPQHSTLHHSSKPLIPSAILGKASLALDVLYRVMNNEAAASALSQDRATVSLLTETLSDLATLAASCEGHMMQLVEFMLSRGGEVGQEQQSQPSTSFIRRLESVVDDEWDEVVDHVTLGEAVWLALSVILRAMEYVGHSPSSREDARAEIFAPSLSVLQHLLKRFPGCDGLVRLALEGYERLARLCFPTVDMQKALLTSLCKLSLPSWGKHDSAAQLEDQHVESLLCLIGIMHNFYPHIATDWEIVLLTLEELSTMSIASPLLTDEGYHSALAISSLYARVAAFSTCLSTDSLVHMVRALCQVVQTCLVEDTDFLLDTNKGSHGLVVDSSATEKHSESISRQILNIGVRAIYGSQANSTEEKSLQSALSDRTRNRFYEEYRRDFIDRISNSKSAIRLDSVGRVPFALALLADVAMANTFRFQECGEKISGSLSNLASSSALVRPFLMDTIAVLTMTHISSGEGSPASFVGPGRIVFQNPTQSQFLAVEHALGKDREVSSTSTKAIIPQGEVLGPLCESLRSESNPDVAESALETLYSVLETADHNLTGDVWSMVITSLSTLSGDQSYVLDRTDSAWSKCCLDAFRCLKFIVNDFSDELQGESAARISLLDCCSSFGSSRQDVNTSLTAIGMLWTIADQDSGTDSIDRALSKLVLLSSDSRPEVRNASVNTLFSCIVGRGGGFSADQWESCIQETVFKVYELVSKKARGEDFEPDSSAPARDAKTLRYKLSLHHSRDSENKQWIATQVVVLRGLMRVLRAFFLKLLDTTDIEAAQPEKALKDDVPWFQDAWVQILDYAFDGATQGGGRDTLTLRSVGVELLTLCCQISSEDGIQSGSPANIGTNMEVVDGALRTVRETKAPAFGKRTRSHSVVCENSRKNFFLEAFEGLESFVENASSADSVIDDTQVQVLTKFSSGLTSLYECSKKSELKTNFSCLDCLSEGMSSKRLEGSLEERFVKIIIEILQKATVDPLARYLNQAQRCCLLLLKALGKDGSCHALRELVKLGDVFFFVKKETDGSDSEQIEIKKSESIGLEAVTAVTDAMNKETQPHKCKAFVLREVLSIFKREGEEGLLANRQNYRFKIDYKRLIPVLVSGVDGCALFEEALQGLEEEELATSRQLIERTWVSLVGVLKIMVTPIPMGKGMEKISRVLEVIELVEAVVPKASRQFTSSLCETLVQAANNSLAVAAIHERCSINHTDADVASKSKRHRNELIQLFAKCLEGSITLQPDHPDLRTVSKKTLDGAVRVMFSSPEEGDSYFIDATLAICQSIRDVEGSEVLLPSLFPYLCKLVSSEDSNVRAAVADTLSAEKTGRLLETAQTRFEQAEERAEAAEQQALSYFEQLAGLKATHDRLQSDFAVLEASTSL